MRSKVLVRRREELSSKEELKGRRTSSNPPSKVTLDPETYSPALEQRKRMRPARSLEVPDRLEDEDEDEGRKGKGSQHRLTVDERTN